MDNGAVGSRIKDWGYTNDAWVRYKKCNNIPFNCTTVSSLSKEKFCLEK